MFGSDVLDIAVGMAFVFLLLSIICSALSEFIETLAKNRAQDLERGLRELIGDPQNATNFIANFYSHPLVNSLFMGVYSEKSKRNLPSYVPAANFALAVMDMVKNQPTTGIKLPANVEAAYKIFKERAADDAAKLQASLEDWFNTGMDRVSGWYKRRAQWILVTLGLVVAVVVNADTIKIAQALSNDASLRKGLVAMAQAEANEPSLANAVKDTQQTAASTGTNAGQGSSTPAPAGQAQPSQGTPAAGGSNTATTGPGTGTQANTTSSDPLQKIKEYNSALMQIGLPIGWSQADFKAYSKPIKSGATPQVELCAAIPGLMKEHALGWLLTAIAISMGAPFWFDLLDKIIAVRTSLKPDTGGSSSGQKSASK